MDNDLQAEASGMLCPVRDGAPAEISTQGILDMQPPSDNELLDHWQQASFSYFQEHCNPANGLIADASGPTDVCSIAAVGMALASYPVAVERGWWRRKTSLQRALAALRFFWHSRQDAAPDATGHKGFYYHFLDIQSGQRAWKCELSSIDSTLLLAGILTASAYFDRDTADERELRELAEAIYRRVDWNWMRNGAVAVAMGWKPEKGFLRFYWQGYNEALILYILGLGSPEHPLPQTSYAAWTETYRWKKIYGQAMLYAGPLFIHQFSQLWLDLRGIQDAYMRDKGIDYFENSRRATYAQQEYGRRNPRGFAGYNANCWGLTASEGPGPAIRQIGKKRQRCWGYKARGVPYGPDDGTLAPWTVAASLPFAPEIVLPALRHFHGEAARDTAHCGMTFNPTFPSQDEGNCGWVSPYHYGVNEGPVVLMLENYRSELLWQLLRRCPYIVNGLRRAGFNGGWLEQ